MKEFLSWLWRVLAAIAVALLLAAWLNGAIAQPANGTTIQPHYHSELGAAGTFYSTWKTIPSARQYSCCDDKDCYSTTIKQQGGRYVYLQRNTGKWLPIPNDRLEHNAGDAKDSPDGQSHVCEHDIEGQNIVLCAVVGGGI